MRVLPLVLLLVASFSCGPRDTEDGSAAAGASAVGVPEGCEVMGTWRHEHPTYASEIVICFDVEGNARVRQAFADGSVYEGDLAPLESDSGQRFLRDAEFGDYYEVLPDGRLVIGDEEGVIATAEPSD